MIPMSPADLRALEVALQSTNPMSVARIANIMGVAIESQAPAMAMLLSRCSDMIVRLHLANQATTERAH